MSKSEILYICSNCQYESQKWQGKCPSCGEWNSLEKSQRQRLKGRVQGNSSEAVSLSELSTEHQSRVVTGIGEFDEVLGGGLVPGSLVLLGGDPGIGKSTLALQISLKLPDGVLYVSGEESAAQIKMRADRIQKNSKLQVLAETGLETVLDYVAQKKPKVVVLDSVQTMYSEQSSGVAGGVAQVTFAVQAIMQLAKSLHITFLLIGHVTKEGYLAGPKTLEHMVDTVLYLEGDRFGNLRVLRCVKNRFGATNEVGVFEMQKDGLSEVRNPSQLFLGEESINASGNCITSVMEGSRPILLEIQALTTASSFGYPKRTTNGFDNNRLQLLCAILQKRAGLNLANQDVYINVVGGIKIDEPASDLAVALSIVSSLKESVIEKTLVLGEVGLSGEVRFVPNLEKRLKEAEKLGFEKAIVPKSKLDIKSKLEVIEVKTLKEAIGILK